MICRICNNEFNPKDDPVLNLLLRDALPEDIRIPFYKCEKCRNLSSDDSLDKEFHIERYRNNHSWAFKTEAIKRRFLEKREIKQRKLNKKISKHIVKSLPDRKMKFFEIGCAEGILLSALHKITNWSIQGIEIDTTRANWGKRKGRLIINAPYELKSFKKGTWDGIAIHEALDHFDNIPEVLRNIRYHLVSNGYLTVLNTIFRWPEEQKRNKFHHSTYFTHDGILNMFNMNGFEVIKIFNIPLPKAGRKFWRAHTWNWSKHLFIAQVTGQEQPVRTYCKKWYWRGKKYKYFKKM